MRNFDVGDLLSLRDGLEYANLELAVVSEINFVFAHPQSAKLSKSLNSILWFAQNPYKDLLQKSILRSDVRLKNSALHKVKNCVFVGLRFHPCPLFWDITTILFDFVIQRSACIIQSSSIWDHFIGFNLTTSPHFTRQRFIKSEFAHFVFMPSFLIFFIFVHDTAALHPPRVPPFLI